MRSAPFLLVRESPSERLRKRAHKLPSPQNQIFSVSAVDASRSSRFNTRPAFAPTQSSWATIPRGGDDDKNSASATTPDMSSLLSGLNGLPGMPDLSQPPSPEQMQQSMAQFQSLLSSPQFQSILNDPQKLDEQMEVKSQVASSFPGGWDGIKALIEDEAKFKEMARGFVDVVKGLGEEDWSSIMSQMGAAGMGGGMPGMGLPGMDTANTLAGLDDLSED
eukprot:scaffold17839_cov72-Cyclotella_meneghiniana.AAC.4